MAEYPQVGLETAGAELNRLHSVIEGKLRSTVQDAIRAGEIIAQVRGRLKHGDFLPWIKANCQFSEDTAERYRSLFEHADKIRTVRNLQEAYRQVETLEAQKGRTEAENARVRIDTFLKTGKRPDGWRRGTDDKLADDELAKRERIKQAQAEWREQDEKRARAAGNPMEDIDRILKDAQVVAERFEQAEIKRQTFKESIRVSHEGKDDPFIDALIDYLETLADDNRRIEACYNVIKVAKGIANQLQVKEGSHD